MKISKEDMIKIADKILKAQRMFYNQDGDLTTQDLIDKMKEKDYFDCSGVFCGVCNLVGNRKFEDGCPKHKYSPRFFNSRMTFFAHCLEEKLKSFK